MRQINSNVHDDVSIDIGQVYINEKSEHEIELDYQDKFPSSISRIQTSCSCVNIIDYTKNVLMSDDFIKIADIKNPEGNGISSKIKIRFSLIKRSVIRNTERIEIFFDSQYQKDSTQVIIINFNVNIKNE